ncbi:hypothetical protein QR680_013985 [Steinernema hermaphroditum]|uniref:Uncharacterized protein n=1 Tax=Steinernema hermaphroditum TaxID=289476 RepID=A0AA39I9E6_9BILA|nr:hypothetical protein QR680_013985 [Steinernema hermaphroditum]
MNPNRASCHPDGMDLVQAMRAFSSDDLCTKFCREWGLLPTEPSTSTSAFSVPGGARPPSTPPTSNGTAGRARNSVWGICGQLQFNPKRPECTGTVTTKMRKSRRDPSIQLLYYCCGSCKKEISQNRSLPNYNGIKKEPVAPLVEVLNGVYSNQGPTFFPAKKEKDQQYRLSRKEIMFIMYCFSLEWSCEEVRYAARLQFPRLNQLIVNDWYRYFKRCIAEMPEPDVLLGGQGVIVHVVDGEIGGRPHLGIIDVGNNLMRIVQVQNFTMEEISIAVIKHIEKGSVIMIGEKLENYRLMQHIVTDASGLPYHYVNTIQGQQFSGGSNQETDRLRKVVEDHMKHLNGQSTMLTFHADMAATIWFYNNGRKRCDNTFFRLVDVIREVHRTKQMDQPLFHPHMGNIIHPIAT